MCFGAWCVIGDVPTQHRVCLLLYLIAPSTQDITSGTLHGVGVVYHNGIIMPPATKLMTPAAFVQVATGNNPQDAHIVTADNRLLQVIVIGGILSFFMCSQSTSTPCVYTIQPTPNNPHRTYFMHPHPHQQHPLQQTPPPPAHPPQHRARHPQGPSHLILRHHPPVAGHGSRGGTGMWCFSQWWQWILKQQMRRAACVDMG